MALATRYYTVNGTIRAQDKGGGDRSAYLPDALGSVTAITDSRGDAVATYRYKPYGAQLSKTGVGNDPKFLWVGQWGYRGAHKDIYVRARHYGYLTSRWKVVDALWPSEPSYAYCYANPVSCVDPLGLSCIDCCEGADAWFNAQRSHCKSGWVACPNMGDLSKKCEQLTAGDCGNLASLIESIAKTCSDMCSMSGGGGYGRNDPWDAAAFCCVENGVSKGCEVRCCKDFVTGSTSSSLRACAAMCLMVHEQKHIAECNKLPPVGGLPPISECCAYFSQMMCLIDVHKKKCAGEPLPQAVFDCIRKSEKHKCSERY